MKVQSDSSTVNGSVGGKPAGGTERSDPKVTRRRWRRAMGIVAIGACTYATLLSLAYAFRPTLTVDLAGDARAVMRGFYAVEHNDTLTWVWTRPQAEVSLATLDRGIPWRWTGRVLLNRPSSATVRIAIDGVLAAEWVVAQNLQPLDVVIPSRPDAVGVTLTFNTIPGFVPGPGDVRELGIAFESMSLEPAASRPAPPAVALLAGSLAMVAFGMSLMAMRMGTGWVLGWLILAAAGQAWLLARGAAAYGPYPGHAVAAGVGLWLGALLFFRTVDGLPAAWHACASRVRARGPYVAWLVGPVGGNDGIRGWRSLSPTRRFVSALRRAWIVGVYTLPAVLFCHSVAFWDHGIIDREGMAFVLNYLADRPLLATIFDPSRNDWGAYQARELSYFFDFIDARVFAALLDRGLLLFIPLSGVVGLVAVTAVYLWGATRVLRLNSVSAALLVSLFLSCIVIQASTAILYRSSKITLSVAFLAILFLVTSLVRQTGGGRRASSGKLAGVFLLGLALSMCDRQGFFLLAALTIIVALLWLTARVRKATAHGHHLAVTVTCLGALAVATLYNYVLAPAVVQWANGYVPSFDYQRLPMADLYNWELAEHAWAMFRKQTGHFFGNAPFGVVSTLVAIGWVATVWSSRATGHSRSSTKTLLTDDVIVLLFATSGTMVAMFALMILRHPAVFSIPDHSLWYYWTPMHVAMLFGVTLWITSLRESGGRVGKVVIYSLVLLMIAGNVVHYDEQRAVMTHSERWFKGQYERSQRLVSAFAVMQDSDPHGEGLRKLSVPEVPPSTKAGRSELERQFLDRLQTAVSRR